SYLRRCTARVDEVVGQSRAAHQVDRLRSAHEEGLGTDVEGAARDLLPPQLSPDPVRALQQGDPGTGAATGELLGRGQTADASPDDEVRGRAGRHADTFSSWGGSLRPGRPVTRS